MQNERRILVTGASGFIGKHLVKRLREEKYEVVESKVRIENEDEVFLLPMSDLVIHLAASVGVPASWDNPQETMSVNIAGTLNVLKYCVKNRADILYSGSYFYLNDAYAKGIHNLEGSREIYNVGYGENWSIAEIAQILATIHGGAEIIDKKVVRSNEIMETCADISKIKNNLGWQPTVRIEEGLAKTYEWYAKKNKERS